MVLEADDEVIGITMIMSPVATAPVAGWGAEQYLFLQSAPALGFGLGQLANWRVAAVSCASDLIANFAKII